MCCCPMGKAMPYRPEPVHSKCYVIGIGVSGTDAANERGETSYCINVVTM